MQIRSILFFLLTGAVAILMVRCANPVSPEGGPKDTKPPRVLYTDPENLSTRFRTTGFTLEFDEYVTLKNAATEVFFSPPLKYLPDLKLRGKSLNVNFEDTLASNTTYSVNFGKSVADLTEGNILKDFNYVFSTGDFIDSMSLQGNIRSAFDLKPQKDVLIGLYINNNDTLPVDSLPLHFPPYYIAKSDENGSFRFNYLQNTKFWIFAISDQNGDMIFNQPSEKIAYLDSLVSPYYIVRSKPDTARSDTTKKDSTIRVAPVIKNADSVRRADSVHRVDSIAKSLKLYPPSSLFLFEETDSIQRLIKSDFVQQGQVLLAFRFPVKKLNLVPLNFDSLAPWHFKEFSRRRDSVFLWITRPETDSLIMRVNADSTVNDTLSLAFVKPIPSRKQETAPKPALTIRLASLGGTFNQFRGNLLIESSYPLVRWNFAPIILYSDKDTLNPVITFADSVHRIMMIKHNWEEAKRYVLLIPDSVFHGIQGVSQDTTVITFTTRAAKEFGSLDLNINLDKRPGNYIIQIVNEAETLIFEERYISKSGKLSFSYMAPGKYKVKAINDRNHNGRWDTGNYRKKLQPEDVSYFQKTIEIRANWDLEESWD